MVHPEHVVRKGCQVRVDQLDSLVLMDHREPQERGEPLEQQGLPEKQGKQ